jgi:DNA-binding HxlR family transcriptional regulator
LIYLQEKGQLRHNELENLIKSHGTLATNLNDLTEEGLIGRKVIPSKPIQSNYFLTEKGRNIAKLLTALEAALK